MLRDEPRPFLIEKLHEPEVEQHRPRCIAGLREDHVRRLDVAVNQARVVRECQRVAQRLEDPEHLERR